MRRGMGTDRAIGKPINSYYMQVHTHRGKIPIYKVSCVPIFNTPPRPRLRRLTIYFGGSVENQNHFMAVTHGKV